MVELANGKSQEKSLVKIIKGLGPDLKLVCDVKDALHKIWTENPQRNGSKESGRPRLTTIIEAYQEVDKDPDRLRRLANYTHYVSTAENIDFGSAYSIAKDVKRRTVGAVLDGIEPLPLPKDF